jgi:phosphoribosyl-AMP cyclohydrolase / phosphoribosyl-ATP pyrophosphohydrolase
MDLRWDSSGLVPVVVVHAATGEVLTVAYMNAESLARTQQTGETWFWSRSRKALWHKGETSGHTQRVVSMSVDCDQDALVVRVVPAGPACHNGTRTCFDGPSGGVLSALDDTLEQRAKELPAGSYTTKLLGDENLRLKKIGEETAELIHAVLKGTDDRAADEAADVLYHTAVALRARGIAFHAVLSKLLERFSATDKR